MIKEYPLKFDPYFIECYISLAILCIILVGLQMDHYLGFQCIFCLIPSQLLSDFVLHMVNEICGQLVKSALCSTLCVCK